MGAGGGGGAAKMKILALIQSKISGEVYQIMNMSRIVFGEIWTMYVNLHLKNNEIGQNFLDSPLRCLVGKGCCGIEGRDQDKLWSICDEEMC